MAGTCAASTTKIAALLGEQLKKLLAAKNLPTYALGLRVWDFRRATRADNAHL